MEHHAASKTEDDMILGTHHFVAGVFLYYYQSVAAVGRRADDDVSGMSSHYLLVQLTKLKKNGESWYLDVALAFLSASIRNKAADAYKHATLPRIVQVLLCKPKCFNFSSTNFSWKLYDHQNPCSYLDAGICCILGEVWY